MDQFTDLLLKFLDRLLTSVLISFFMALASFSYFTGKFPPRKDDVYKAINLSRQMLSKTPELKSAGEAPNLQEIAEFQRLNLRRTEATLELVKIFEKINLGTPSPETSEKINKLSLKMKEIETEITELSLEMQPQ